ncbi:MAG: hypothetical protein JWN72_2750 [Thermoleophilia bacterium]|nr:hypothetical protein [Thermoleophilia bacterium]
MNLTAAPLANPAAYDKFLGKRLVHADFTPQELKDVKGVGERIAPNGFSTLGEALEAARSTIDASNATSASPTAFHHGAAIVKNDAEYGIVWLNSALLLVHPSTGGVVGRPDFHWYDPSVVGAVRGDGKVMENAGKVHFWN